MGPLRRPLGAGRCARVGAILLAALAAIPAVDAIAAPAGATFPAAADAPRRVLPPEVAPALRLAFAEAVPAWRLQGLRVEGDRVTGQAAPVGGPDLAFRLDDPLAGCTGRLAGGFCLHLAASDVAGAAAGRDGPLVPSSANAAIEGLIAALQRQARSPYVVVTPKRAAEARAAPPSPRPSPPAAGGTTGAPADRGAPAAGQRNEGAGSQGGSGRSRQVQARPEPEFDAADIAAALALGLGVLAGGLGRFARQERESAGESGAG